MSYGPQLPPHLQKRNTTVSDNIDKNTGSVKDTANTLYGPALPSKLEHKISVASASGQNNVKTDSYGPQLPKELNHYRLSDSCDIKQSSKCQSDDDEDDFVGPLPPSHSESVTTFKQEQINRQLEERARMIKEKLSENGEADEAPLKRDSWMVELPAEKAKNFGLGPRQFSRSLGPKPQRDRSWTDTPEMKAKRAEMASAGIAMPDEDVQAPTEEKDVLEYMAGLKRDQEMEVVANELKKKRGLDSLVELHEKEKVKKHKKEKRSKKSSSVNEIPERRPFDRDLDLQANRFDEAAKKRMLKNAGKLNDKFSSGNQKYL